MRPSPRLVAILICCAAACSTGGTESTATTVQIATTAVPSTTLEVTTTTAAERATTTGAADAAPPELAGQWRTQRDTGNPAFDRVFINFNGTQFVLNEGGFSIPAKLSVEGDQIRIYGGLPIHCDGEGIYQWSVEGETLTLTALEPIDPCAQRRGALDGLSYSR